MKVKYAFVILILFQMVLVSCSDIQLYEEEDDNKIVELKDVEYHLPDRAGRELLIRNCMICHSLRYIQMQPDLSRKMWEKTVDKMIKNFGAPVRDSLTAGRIVDYLMTIKGKPE